MPTVGLWTFKDAIDHAIDFLGADVSNEADRESRRCILSAYREIANVHRWSYFYARGRIATVAPYSTGTVEYDHTGGASERMLTITGGIWPEWAAYGVLAINNILYEVAERQSTTVLILSATSNPGQDVAATTTYQLYRDTYPLPSDAVALDEVISVGQQLSLQYQHPRTWIGYQRIVISPGEPCAYTITGDQNYFGALALKLTPPPDNAYSLDFIYQRRPRQLLTADHSAGTVSVTSAQNTVTGSGTAFNSLMVGATIRLSDSQTVKPTGLVGSTPYVQERIIMSRSSATVVTVDAAFDQTLTAVKYVVSDPIDIEEGAMLTAFWRTVEKELSISKRMKDRQPILVAQREAMLAAMEADSRSFQPRAASSGDYFPRRLKDYPSGPDVS